MAKKLRTLPKKLVRALAREWAERFRSEEFEARSRAAKKAAVTRKRRERERIRETRRRRAPLPGMTAPEVQALARISTPENQREVLRFKQGALRVEFEHNRVSVQDIAASDGVGAAIDAARHFGVMPDEWAEDIAEDYDYETHALYDEFFYPASGSAAW